jgi:hypothetical protein
MQSKASKRRIKEILVEPVKSFCQVDFKKKSMMLPGFERKRVNNFLDDNNVGRNMSVLYESHLRVVNIIGQVRLKSISQGFSNNLIDNIT